VVVVCGDASALDLPEGRFTGAASFHMLHHIPTVKIQDEALAELARVLKKGAVLVAADGVPSDASLAFHEGDTYNPIDPDGLGERLERAGFTSVDVQLHDLGWFCTGVAT
jgi:SAM-dependent methyltransferase